MFMRLTSRVVVLPAKEKKKFSVLSVIPIVISCIALSVSITVAYLQNRVHHDLAARVVRATLSILEQPTELYVETAVVNRGNQSEIIREIRLLVSDDEKMQGGATIFRWVLNQRIEKGDKQVFKHSITNFHSFEGKSKWMNIEVVAIAPDLRDITCVWPVMSFNVATNGQGGGQSEHPDSSQSVQIISDKRLPHQRDRNRSSVF